MSAISLNSRFDHLHIVTKTWRAVDDFHAGIALKYGHDAAATIMSIKANFCVQDLNGTLTFLFSHLNIVSGKAVAAFTAEWLD